MIIWSLAGNGGKCASRPAIQNHPDNRGIGRVRATLLVGLLPLRVERFPDLHRWIGRPVEQEISQTADENGCWLISAHPTKLTYRALFGRAFDHLRHRSDGVSGSEPDDLLGGLLHRDSWIADGVAGVGASRESAPGSQRPLTEWLVPRQPARQCMALQFVG